MKQVTIETVRERIARIEECANQMAGGLRLSMNTEFELSCLRVLLASLESVPMVPHGWQLVPSVPTQEMCNAVLGRACFSGDGDGARYIFNAMLKHAPALPLDEPATDNAAPQFEALAKGGTNE